MQNLGNKGFTLIEILMVVIIVGILATLALPEYTKLIEKAKMSEARANLSAIATAEKIYYAENDSWAALADLPISINDGSFTYSVATSVATATRAAGTGSVFNGDKITLDFSSDTWTYGGDYAKLGPKQAEASE